MKEICFRALPNVRFVPLVEDILKHAKGLGIATLLIAYEDESFVKEALYSLKACYYFHKLLIVNEYFKGCADQELLVENYIEQNHGNNVIYINHPDENFIRYFE